jgi:hypothetical protein
MSVSWDKTLKIWRSWRKPSSSNKKVELDKEKKFETWIWSQMKKAARCEETDFTYIE